MFNKALIILAIGVLMLVAACVVADAKAVDKTARIACVNYVENGAYLGDPVPGPVAGQYLYSYSWHCDGTVTVTWNLRNPNAFPVQVRAAGQTFNMTPGERMNLTTTAPAVGKTKITADTYVWRAVETPEQPPMAMASDEAIMAPELPEEPAYEWVYIGSASATFNPAKALELDAAPDTQRHSFDLGPSSDTSYIFVNNKPAQQINGKSAAAPFDVSFWESLSMHGLI